MNVVRSRIPNLVIALTVVLIAGASVAAVPLEAQRPTVRKPAATARAAVQPADPCCDITAIDARAGLVTAKNLETGATFQFRVTDRRLLGSLAVGQKVYADDAGEKAGLTPGIPCCSIVAGANNFTPAQPVNDVRAAAAGLPTGAQGYTGPAGGEEADRKACLADENNEYRCTDIGSGKISCHCIHNGPTKDPSDPGDGGGGGVTVMSSEAQAADGAIAGRSTVVRPPRPARDVRGSRTVRATATSRGHKGEIVVGVTPAGGLVRAVVSGTVVAEARDWDLYWRTLIRKINACKEKYPDDEKKRIACIDDAIVKTSIDLMTDNL